MIKKIIINGIVQGVGFRPFIYNLANKYSILGEVYNDASGVIIFAEESNEFKNFFDAIKSPPPLAKITNITLEGSQKNTQYYDFKITRSKKTKNITTAVPKDACICSDCIKDITDKNNRRYRYAFTNCTNCGPRFSIIKAMPYDRKTTSMKAFNLCADCKEEYKSISNRRFHAQANACTKCGPKLQLVDNQKNIIHLDAIKTAVELLKQGKILAIKGIGGFHLTCLADDKKAVNILRDRKKRKHKPFALMAKNVEMVKKYCKVSAQEDKLLKDTISPIVLLTKNTDLLAKNIAYNQNKLGFMLPYSPLHYLLLKELNKPIVLTSGNRNNEPQIIDNTDALNKLAKIADYFLLHNRDIVNKVDDSVMQIIAGQTRIIRAGRGLSPISLPLPKGFANNQGVLALGAELKNTFCLLTNSQAIISQHIGDLKTLESYQDFQKNINLYQQLYEVDIKKLVCDLHPDYLSSKYAQNYAQDNNIELQKVQHHHAHIASCLFENKRPINCNNVLGIVWDGAGLGEDKNLWGGEFLLANYSNFKRIAQFEYVPMFGGDKVTLEPWRMAYAYFEKYQINTDKYFKGKPTTFFDKLIDSDIAFKYTSSVGRLFDAVAYILGICNQNISYEAQASIELESLASICKVKQQQTYDFELELMDGYYIVNSKKMWLSLLNDLRNNVGRENIAYKFHLSLASLIIKMTTKLKQQYSFDDVVLSGGVFNNKLLLELCFELFKNTADIHLMSASKTSLGDGAISLGQAAIHVAKIK